MLPPSGAIRLRTMILPHIPGGRAPPGSDLGATPPYAAVTIFILGDYRDLDNLEAVVCVEYVRVHFDTSRQRGPCATTGQELCLAS